MEVDFKAVVEEMIKNDPAEPVRRILHSEESTTAEKQIARERLRQMRKNDMDWTVSSALYDYNDAESEILYEDRWRTTDRSKSIIEAHSRWVNSKPKQKISEKPASMPTPESSAIQQTAMEEKPDFTASLPDFDIRDVLSEEDE